MLMIEHIINLIAPHYCLGCEKQGSLLCDACLVALPRLPSRCYGCGVLTAEFAPCRRCAQAAALHKVWSLTLYESHAKALIHKLKFEHASAAAPVIAASMADSLPAGTDWIVTHVPTATSRIRQRGYDQAQLIARELARRMNCAYAPLLARAGQQRQVGQSRQARIMQLAGSFKSLKRSVRGKHVLLVDDVVTTGATLDAAAAALKKAGAVRVDAATFAAA